MKISYISAGLAGFAVALACRYYFVTVENTKMRTEGFEFQQLVESLQPQLQAKKQQLQAQQEKLNKGSAISQSIGPAVLGDIRSSADKNNNLKLKELLSKYGVREAGAATPPAGAATTPAGAATTPAGDGGAAVPAKKGGN